MFLDTVVTTPMPNFKSVALNSSSINSEQTHKKESLCELIYSQLRLIEPPVNRFHCLIGSKFHRTELQFGLQYFRLIDFSA